MNNSIYNRAEANKMASTLFGKSIQSIVRRNVDPEYKSKSSKGDLNLLLAKPLQFFAIETITVSALEIVETPNDFMIRVNGNDDLMFPITSAALPEPTDKELLEALENFEDGKVKYFADYETILGKIIAWNSSEAKRGEAAMAEVVAQIGAINKANEAERNAFKAYQASMK